MSSVVYCKIFETYLQLYIDEKLYQRSEKTKHGRISDAQALTGASRSRQRRGPRGEKKTSFTRRSRVLFSRYVGDSYYPLTPITLLSPTYLKENYFNISLYINL